MSRKVKNELCPSTQLLCSYPKLHISYLSLAIDNNFHTHVIFTSKKKIHCVEIKYHTRSLLP